MLLVWFIFHECDYIPPRLWILISAQRPTVDWESSHSELNWQATPEWKRWFEEQVRNRLGIWLRWFDVLFSEFIFNAHQNCSKSGMKMTFVLMTVWRKYSTSTTGFCVGMWLWKPTELRIDSLNLQKFRSHVLMQRWYHVLAPYQSPDKMHNGKSAR